MAEIQVLDSGDETLLYTQQMRRRLVSQMVKSGSVPSDPKEANVFLSALADMDRQVLTVKKIAADKDNGDKAVAMAAIISGIFNDPRTKTYNQIPSEEPVADRSVVLDLAIVPTVLIPGELGPIGIPEDYKTFMKRMNDPSEEAPDK